MDKDLTLDPKRYSKKMVELRRHLKSGNHFFLGDVVDFFPEKTSSNGEKIRPNKAQTYSYVEIADIGHGDYFAKEMRGWELPSRAKHFAEADDIYFGAIWGSAVKWCYIPKTNANIVVTNGCFRCRIKPGKEKLLPDLLAYMNTEGWGVQLRAFARGSDGLAEICLEDAKKVIIPELSENLRNDMAPYVQHLKTGTDTLNSFVTQLIKNHCIDYFEPEKRPSHIVLV